MSDDAKTSKTLTKVQPKKVLVEPVFGRMVHVLTGVEIKGLTEVAEIDGWLQAQIDAGKLKVVA